MERQTKKKAEALSSQAEQQKEVSHGYVLNN